MTSRTCIASRSAWTAAGWSITRESGDAICLDHCDKHQYSVDKLELAEFIPGGYPELLLHYVDVGAAAGAHRQVEWKDEYVVIAGVGPSGKPSATAPILTSSHRSVTDEGRPLRRSSTQLVARYVDGQLEIVGDGRELETEKRGALLGRHWFVFP